MKNLILLQRVWLALGLSSLLAISPVTAQSPFLIVPGERIGPIELGMSIQEVVGILGTPPIPISSAPPGSNCTRASATEPSTCDYQWITRESPDYPGLRERETVTTVRGIVQSIAVDDERYTTAEGIHVGLGLPMVTAILGAPQSIEEFTGPSFGGDIEAYRTLMYPGLHVLMTQVTRVSPIKRTWPYEVREIKVVPFSTPKRHV